MVTQQGLQGGGEASTVKRRIQAHTYLIEALTPDDTRWLLLLVVRADGQAPDDLAADDDLRREVATALRSRLSPRHVPDDLVVVPALPRTLSGKKLEVPAKKILLGADPEVAASAGALTDPSALDVLVTVRERLGTA